MTRDRRGKVLGGRYALRDLAGEGGMATVWRARDLDPAGGGRTVAVKRVLAERGADASLMRLFEEEARVGQSLHHPSIVEIHDFGTDEDGDYYLVMEWVEGLDLHQWAASFPAGVRPTPWPLAVAIGVEVLRGLDAAHRRVGEDGIAAPVFHRDVSPSNVLLGSNGAVKVTDFGLARAMDRSSMTRSNTVKGKLAYCAPELIYGSRPSPRSDLFAASVVLWEVLAQERLFTGQNDIEVLLAVRQGHVPPLTELRQDVPRTLVDTLETGLASAPEDRFASASLMAQALSAVLRAHAEPVGPEHIGQSVLEARRYFGLPDRSSQAP
ncbi:MAG: serine/threonine-protein kinase [Sandaracinaceae bacterium]